MSTDAPRVGRAARRYRRTFTAVVASLALVAGALAVVGSTRGPRLSDVDVNPLDLVERQGGSLLLRTDQRLAADSSAGAQIEPEVRSDVTVGEGGVVIEFGELLNYGTEYTVTLPALRSLDTGRTSSTEYTFITPDPVVHTLERSTAEGGSAILRQNLSGSETPSPLYAAPNIQEYAITPSALFVVELDETGLATLIHTDEDAEDPSYTVPQPAPGSIRELHSSGSSDLAGYILAGEQGSGYESTLFVYDPRDGSGIPRPVADPGGAPLQVIDWRFLRGTTTIVAQTVDGSLFVIDATEASVTQPLGQYGEVRGFIPGSTELLVRDPEQYQLLDLGDGSAAPFQIPEGGPGEYPGPPVALGDAPRVARTFSDRVDETLVTRVGVGDPDGWQVVFEPSLPGTRVLEVCPAPNGKFLAIVTAGEDAEPDEYPILGGFQGMTTAYVDLDTGRLSRTSYGFLPDWCQ